MPTLKQGLSVTGKNLTVDESKFGPLTDAQKAKLTGAGYSYGVQSTTPKVTVGTPMSTKSNQGLGVSTPAITSNNSTGTKSNQSLGASTVIKKDATGNVSTTVNGVAQPVKTVVPPKVDVNGAIVDDTTPVTWTVDELKAKGLTEYADFLQNSPEELAIFNAQGAMGENNLKEFLKTRNAAVQDFNIRRGRTADNAEANKKLTAIQQNQNIRSANDQLTRAKNIAGFARFSSSSSPERTDAISKRVNEIDTQLNEMVEMHGIINEENAAQIQEQLRQMDKQIRDSVGNLLFEKLNELDQSIASGEVATPEQLDNLFKRYSEAILKEAPILTEAGLAQMSRVATSFMNQQQEMRAYQQQFAQNQATFAATPDGFYVDGNGMQVVGQDGQPVKAPARELAPPQFDSNTGMLYTFGFDENGVLDPKAVPMKGFVAPEKEPAKRNLIETKDGLYDVDNNKWLIAPGQTAPTTTPDQSSVPYTPPTGFESRGAGASVAVKNTGDGIEIGIPSGTKLEGIGGQCGGLVNDFAKTIPGYTPVGNTYESKMANNNSDVPAVGGLAMWTPGKFEDNGHIGIVEKVFADGSFQLYDTNYVAANTTSRRIIKPGDKEYNLIQKTGGFFDPNKVGGGQAQSLGNLSSLGQFMKDNQSMGPGYSEKDVERFDEKIDRYVANGDSKAMAKAYREMLLRDTDFKKEFDNTQKFTQALDDVDTMIKQYESAGKSTNALKSMAEKVARKLGVTTDTALAQLQTQMGFTLANYIRSISGTAASDVEVQRLMGNMASIGNVQELNTALVEQARNNATSSLKSMVDTRMYGLPEELKPEVFGDIYTETTAPQSTTTQTEGDWWSTN